MKAFLEPSSIAIADVAPSGEDPGLQLLFHLKESGYPGALWPVCQEADDVLGLPAVRSLIALQSPPDLCILSVDSELLRERVGEAAGAGVRTILVMSPGVGRAGCARGEEEQKIAAICAQHRIRLLGPDCDGVINTRLGMHATLDIPFPQQGPVSVLSQSGALWMAILDWMRDHGLGISKAVHTGNRVDINEIDWLRELAADDPTRVIAGYLEDIEEGDAFLEAAEQAASRKPVVLLKVGATQAGARAVALHTGIRPGGERAYGAAFRRAGIVRAESLDALYDFTLALALQPLPRGNRVAVISNAGGPAVMGIDAVDRAGMRDAELGLDTRKALLELLPEASKVGNPVMVMGNTDPDRFAKAFAALHADPNVDIGVVVITPHPRISYGQLAEHLAAAADRTKPMLVAFLGADPDGKLSPLRLAELSLPSFPSPTRAVQAAKVMADYAEWLRRPPRAITRFAVNHRRVNRIVQWHQRMNLKYIGDIPSKEILHAYGFQVPEGATAATAHEAVEAAQRIGFPVVMKVVSPDILHKSDIGGVRVNLVNEEQIRDAFDLMMLRIHRVHPRARIRGIHIEKMGYEGRQVTLGMVRDPHFGPMLMFGLGGIFVEVMKDVTFHLAPITREEAMQMLRATRRYEVLQGTPGQPAVDLETVADGLQRISQLSTEYPAIQEVDLHPFVVGAVGVEPYVADAHMVLGAHPLTPVPA